MIYKFQVPQIHCSGCVNLIKITLEDDLRNLKVDQESKEVQFESELTQEELSKVLDELFVELKQNGYTYTNLEKVK